RCTHSFKPIPYTTLFRSRVISIYVSRYTESIGYRSRRHETKTQVPGRLASTYPGTGGCSHRAGVKTQLGYGLLSGEFFDVKIERSEEHTSELQSRFDLVC